MKRVAAHDLCVEHCIRNHVRGPTYLVWNNADALNGVVFWGHIEPRYAARLLRTLDAQTDPQLRPSLVDVRRVESIDPAAIDLLSNYVLSHADKLRQRVSAQALLRPHGPVGIIVAGLYEVIKHSYPVEVFTDPYEALNWLGAADQSGIIAATDDLLDGLSCTSVMILSSLRTHLSRNPGNAKLGTASAALGLSPRSLQRKLRDVNTSFQLEQNTMQIGLAKRLLSETNDTIKRVAFEVGCSSGAAFSVLFRKFEGQSPSDWRNRHAQLNQLGEREQELG